MAQPAFGPLDAALDFLTRHNASGPSLKSGLSNHVPMALEALESMGADIDLMAFAAAQANDIAALPQGTAEPEALASPAGLADIDTAAAMLGTLRDFSVWQLGFATAFDHNGVEATVKAWIPRLAPGFFGAANHGVIRAGHALRSWRRSPSDARQTELAAGFAYWASAWQPLALDTQASSFGTGTEPLTAVLQGLPEVPAAKRKTDGSLVAAVAQLSEAQGLGDRLGTLALPDPIEVTAADATRAFANGFRATVVTPLDAIIFTHAITGIAAVLNLLPLTATADQRPLLWHAIAASCALYCAYGRTGALTSEHDLGPVIDSEELVRRAASNGDAHAIKLTEACLEFYRRTDDPVFLATTTRGMTVLGSN
ncbi:MAG: hypothetical protein AAF648_15700 [Pseudomonadota bacterium]